MLDVVRIWLPFCKFNLMKPVLSLFSCLSFAALLLCCAPLQAQENTPENIHRKWMLIEYQNFTKEELTQLGAFMDLRAGKVSKNAYSAKMGCNTLRFSGIFKKNGSVHFSGIASTRMYCEGRMKLEELFGKELGQMTSYHIAGHFLTLSDGKGNIMKWVAEDWD